MKSLKTLGALTVLAAALATSAAYADAPRYDFLDFSFQNINDPSGSGLSSDHANGLGGSYAFTSNIIGAVERLLMNAWAPLRDGQSIFEPDWEEIRRYERPRLAEWLYREFAARLG